MIGQIYVELGAVATAIDTWFHIAVVRYGDTFKMYIDGTAASTTRTQSGDMAPSAGPQIGWHRSSTTRYLKDSYIDEFRISNVARYTANFTAFGQGGGTISSPTAFTTDANTQLLLHLDGANDGTTFTDSSDTTDPRHIVTVANGDTTNTRISNHSVAANADAHIIGPKIGSSAIAFDGTGDYLSAPSCRFGRLDIWHRRLSHWSRGLILMLLQNNLYFLNMQMQVIDGICE